EYAIVDIETTGNYSGRHRITEIAIFIHDGKKIIEEFQTLINPECSIPPYITTMTGIHNEMVEDAPKFYEVAKTIYKMLENRIFVAHNVGFDYSFIRQEFKSLGGNFQAKKLCTVRMGRKIIPGLPSYSLGNLCKHLGIVINDRHRAAGDAEATVKVLEYYFSKDDNGQIDKALKRNSGEYNLPPNLPKEQFVNLPEDTGVYYFIDQKGQVIYVGKAKNIKNRIKGHFSPGSETSHKQNLIRAIHGISYELCGNELVALLYETHEIQRLWPTFNRAQKRISWNYGIYSYDDRNGYIRLQIGRTNKAGKPLASFKTLASARSFVKKKTEEFELCPKLTGLQQSPGSCFDYQIKKCNGACTGKETSRKYNSKVKKALRSFVRDNFSVAIIGAGRSFDESSVVWVEDGKYKGFGYFDNTNGYSNIYDLRDYIKSYPDNQDIQKFIHFYLRTNKNYQLIPISEQPEIRL
ncbi:exonuclease domain-containing protein, partial [Bacteroidota bacterium]